MDEEYDTDAFVIFVIAFLSIYLLFASIFIFRRLRRAFSKDKNVVSKKKQQLVEVEEEEVENPLTKAFWINVALAVISLIIITKLLQRSQIDEPDLFDPYATLGITVGANERAIKSAYRKMAKLYHPDKPTGSVEKFRDIERAYRILTDEIARANYERYGNPDGPAAMKVGIALPSWMMEKTGSKLVVVGYLLLMILVIPGIVYCLKKNTNREEKPKISDDTIAIYYHGIQESTPIQCIPEIFARADELLALMPQRAYDRELLTYLNIMCPKTVSGSRMMFKPHVSLEDANKDAKAMSWLKTNILVHAYLNHLEVIPQHRQEQLVILSKAPELMRTMFSVGFYSRQKGKPNSLAIMRKIVQFEQYMYQGLWLNESPLKQLPHFGNSEVNSNHSRNREHELVEFLRKDPKKWKGLQRLLDEQIDEIKEVVHVMPLLYVEPRFEVEDEEDIFVGDVVTCILKVVHENLLPENVSAKDVAAGTVHLDEEEEGEEGEEEGEEKEEKENPNRAITIDELEEMNAKKNRLNLSPGIVYSRNFPYKIHEHWVTLLSDAEDKVVYDVNMITNTSVFFEQPIAQFQVPKAGKTVFHLHFMCPVYMGLDFTVTAVLEAKPESMKPKFEINQKDLDLDKKKGFMDMLNYEEDDGWESNDEEEEAAADTSKCKIFLIE